MLNSHHQKIAAIFLISFKMLIKEESFAKFANIFCFLILEIQELSNNEKKCWYK